MSQMRRSPSGDGEFYAIFDPTPSHTKSEDVTMPPRLIFELFLGKVYENCWKEENMECS